MFYFLNLFRSAEANAERTLNHMLEDIKSLKDEMLSYSGKKLQEGAALGKLAAKIEADSMAAAAEASRASEAAWHIGKTGEASKAPEKNV